MSGGSYNYICYRLKEGCTGQMYDAEDSCATEFFFSVDKDTFAQYSTITFRYEAGT